MSKIYNDIDNNLKNILNNNKIKSKKIAIFPFGEGGVITKYLLNNKYGIDEEIIIDNSLCKMNNKIKDSAFLKKCNLDEYIFLIACSKPKLIRQILVDINVPIENIKIVFGNELLSQMAIRKLLDDYSFKTVLDIGCGEGIHSKIFMDNDKDVTSIDVYKSEFNLNKKTIIDDFMSHQFEDKYDCVWCSHVLEHQLNVNIFLNKVNDVLKEGGILALSVPNYKKEFASITNDEDEEYISSGHVTKWNPGMLIYNLVLAGFNCKNISIKIDGYNLSVILKKELVRTKYIGNVAHDLDIEFYKEYFPQNIKYKFDMNGNVYFQANIPELNW